MTHRMRALRASRADASESVTDHEADDFDDLLDEWLPEDTSVYDDDEPDEYEGDDA